MSEITTILIVDDEPAGRETLDALLSSHGYHLLFAGNGPDALAQAAAHPPDLILLDVMMPGMDGFEVCRRLRADPLLGEVPVIMLTALDDRESRLQGIAAGADDFISKPFDRVELRTRVQMITRLNRYRRLRTERTKSAWVLEQADDGFLLVNATDQVQYANAQARAYLSLPSDPDAPITESFRTLVQQHYQCEPQAAWAAWPDLPPSAVPMIRYLVRPESATAGVCWLAVSTLRLPSDADGEWLIQLRDITAQMAMQGDMWKFQAMVYHKLRTPLMHLLGVELLAQDAAGLPLELIAEIAAIAGEGARRLKGTIDEVLGYMSAPSLVAPEAGFPLDQLSTLVQAIGAAVGVETVTVTCQDELMRARLGLAPQTIELILGELLANAKKFHPRQAPTVEIRVCAVDARAVCIQVGDDGVTLAAEQLAQAWTPYYQGEKHFTGEVPGMGLGLAKVATIIWGVGGTCRIANRDNEPGVIVEFTVPVMMGSDEVQIASEQPRQ
jgi:two-component system cell cycle response regulator